MPVKKQLTELEMRAALQTKIEECAKAIGHQEQNAKSAIGYHFTSNEQMMTVVRGALLVHKLGLICDMLEYSEREFNGVNKYNKPTLTIRSIVKIKVTITDLDTGHQLESYGIGADQDTQGKSMQQAVTQAFKYWIFKNFKVSSQMEKDPDLFKQEIDPTETAIYEIQNAKTIAQLKTLHGKYGHLGAGVVSELTNRRKQIENA